MSSMPTMSSSSRWLDRDSNPRFKPARLDVSRLGSPGPTLRHRHENATARETTMRPPNQHPPHQRTPTRTSQVGILPSTRVCPAPATDSAEPEHLVARSLGRSLARSLGRSAAWSLDRPRGRCRRARSGARARVRLPAESAGRGEEQDMSSPLSATRRPKDWAYFWARQRTPRGATVEVRNWPSKRDYWAKRIAICAAVGGKRERR